MKVAMKAGTFAMKIRAKKGQTSKGTQGKTGKRGATSDGSSEDSESNEEASDDENAGVVVQMDDDDDEQDSKLKSICPPALKLWINQMKAGKNPKWNHGCSQGVGDWVNSFKTAGHHQTATALDQSKGSDRITAPTSTTRRSTPMRCARRIA